MGGIRPPLTPERFWARAIRNENGCLVWQGSTNGVGYGKLQRYKVMMYAHRYAYELTHGSISENLVIDHLCENPSCIEPTHLEAVPQGVNNARGGWARTNRNKTHCPHGHLYDEANTYVDRHGGRFCRACRNKSVRAWALKNPEKVREIGRRSDAKRRPRKR